MGNESSIIDELLNQLTSSQAPQLRIEEGDHTYIISRKSYRDWQVRKLIEDSAVDYKVQRFKGDWTCTCPAGMRNRRCKHVEWVSTIAHLKGE